MPENSQDQILLADLLPDLLFTVQAVGAGSCQKYKLFRREEVASTAISKLINHDDAILIKIKLPSFPERLKASWTATSAGSRPTWGRDVVLVDRNLAGAKRPPNKFMP
ncbi:MAG: hypothetical protein U0V70_12130 [Terriglobia bacterium]